MGEQFERVKFRTLREKALAALRIYGPAPNIEIARAAGLGGEQFHGIVYRLRREGLAKKSREGYDVTEAGRRLADGIIKSTSRINTLFG